MKKRAETDIRWLLLIQQIPRKLQYLRVKTWRRLNQLGAVPIKNAVYALPRSEDRNEDLQWVIREIVEGGGEATVVEAAFIQGMNDAEVEALFSRARDENYAELSELIGALAKKIPRSKITVEKRKKLDAEAKRLRQRFDDIARIDFFSSSGQQTTRGLLDGVETRLRQPTGKRPDSMESKASLGEYKGRTWVTRKGIFVDRIGSAWLIRRFIDPKAAFKFVPGKGYDPEPREIRFDMFEAEFTHVGDRCTFEVLIDRMGLDDPGLKPLAEIIHDIDIKDAKFQRTDAPGIERLLAAIASRAKDDEERLARGSEMFDDLYELFRKLK